MSTPVPRRRVGALVTAAVVLLGLGGGAAAASQPGVTTWTGTPHALGNGQIRNVVTSTGDKPLSIGVRFDASSLTGLPYHPPTDGTHCFDANADGVVDDHMECVGGYEQRLPFPSRTVNAPYRYTMLNWNPMGHSGMIYGKPHFDFHFYLTTPEATDAIRMGPCGPELVNCDDLITALEPLPDQYHPAGYVAPEAAVEGGMGSHMVDPASPINEAFTRTLIYGKYDAQLTFIEPMITVAYLQSLTGRTQNACEPVAQPKKWQQAGWYPTTYCVGYDQPTDTFNVTLESFKRG